MQFRVINFHCAWWEIYNALLTHFYLHSHHTQISLYTEQSLRDNELPAAVKEQWVGQGVDPHFQLRLRASGIIRVQYRLGRDQEVSGLKRVLTNGPIIQCIMPFTQTFRSLIVTPHMTSCDVLQVALAQIAPREPYTDYHLIEKTPLGGTDCSS